LEDAQKDFVTIDCTRIASELSTHSSVTHIGYNNFVAILRTGSTVARISSVQYESVVFVPQHTVGTVCVYRYYVIRV
jgi:hypothetical protein